MTQPANQPYYGPLYPEGIQTVRPVENWIRNQSLVGHGFLAPQRVQVGDAALNFVFQRVGARGHLARVFGLELDPLICQFGQN